MIRPPTASPAWRRGTALLLLTLVVTALHLWLASQLPASRLGSGSADTRPQRIEVSFVRELVQAAPPEVAPAAPRAAAPRRAPRRAAVRPAAVASAASAAPADTETAPTSETVVAEAVVEPPAEAVSAVVADTLQPADTAASAAEPTLVAAAAEPAADPAASAPAPFEWPPSTRLSYVLTGNVRGPVDGQAQVEWVRAGERYQVHLDVSVGPSFAPLLSRRITSDGELGDEGLRPRRYDEETKVALRDPRRLTILLDDDVVRLPGGKELPRPAGVQDAASQFVQLTWLFTMQPGLLERGSTIELPLALPRYIDQWTYEVQDRELLYTAAGPIETVHVKPRRVPRRSNELSAEMWIAPSLQYLPVRIVIRMDAETYIDLVVKRLPQQAQAEPAPTSR
jgi:Protein of unknown function (DUF3108)